MMDYEKITAMGVIGAITLYGVYMGFDGAVMNMAIGAIAGLAGGAALERAKE